MTLRKLEETPVMKNPHQVDARNLYTAEEAMVTVISLRPGGKFKEAYNPGQCSFLCS